MCLFFGGQSGSCRIDDTILSNPVSDCILKILSYTYINYLRGMLCWAILAWMLPWYIFSGPLFFFSSVFLYLTHPSVLMVQYRCIFLNLLSGSDWLVCNTLFILWCILGRLNIQMSLSRPIACIVVTVGGDTTFLLWHLEAAQRFVWLAGCEVYISKCWNYAAS